MAILNTVNQLPLWLFGLSDIPGVPIQLDGMADTVVKLGIRAAEAKQARQGLIVPFKIGNETAIAYEFLFGRTTSIVDEAEAARREVAQALASEPTRVLTALFEKAHRDVDVATNLVALDPLTTLALDQPEQWSMSWTTFPDVYHNALPRLAGWAASLTDPDAASAQFWPTIATYGLAFNLLILQKVAPEHVGRLKSVFQTAWTPDLDAAVAAGALYAIDLSLFESLAPNTVRGTVRFTPATFTLLSQDPVSKALTPVAVRVSGQGGAGAQFFTRARATSSAWLYALQAAKASVTVYGIWLGHVYHWHIVTAAMQMTLYNHVPAGHPIDRLLAPQSNYLIPFDDVLIVLWQSISPSTSLSSPFQFLTLCNQFAKGRGFFDDDPLTTLAAQGIQQADFTVAEPWDQFPIVGHLLAIWSACQEYVEAFVNATYADDRAVALDVALQAWMIGSAAPREGNVRGLPEMTTKAALASVLTSLIYRITAHGCGRLNSSANPALTFVANFPPCLQDTTIPAPDAHFDTRTLLTYLPRTGTIGEMVTFYFTFAFSVPYTPFIPLEGIDADLFFAGGASEPRNQALIRFRNRILAVIATLDPESPQRFQWPLNIET